MSSAGGSGRTSSPVVGYVLTAFNMAVGVFVAVAAMQGDSTKNRIDELTLEVRQLRISLTDTREKMIEINGRVNGVERERRE